MSIDSITNFSARAARWIERKARNSIAWQWLEDQRRSNRKLRDAARMPKLEETASWEARIDYANHFFAPNQHRAEILGLLNWVAEKQPSTAIEIGTFQGGTSFLLSCFPSVRKIVMIDLFVQNRRLLKELSRPGVEWNFVDGDSKKPSTVAKVARLLGSDTVDILFIDGDHTWAGVAGDFLAYAKKVRKGGTIAFHDIVPDYGRRFGTNTGRYAGDVPVLWDFIKKRAVSREFVLDPAQDALGIGAITWSDDFPGFSELSESETNL